MKKIILTLILLLPCFSYATTTYDMQDLNKLAKSESWLELTEHLTDIAPSKRNEDWESLANIALHSRFHELILAGNSIDSLKFLDDAFSKYPGLKENKDFMQLRAEFGLDYYESCFSFNDKACHRILLGFVKLDPNPMFALKVAKEVRRRMSENKAIEYFEVALSRQGEQSMCEDEDLKIALASALQATSESRYAKAAKKVAFGRCFKSVRSVIITAVKNSENAKGNACEELLSRNAIKGISGAKCKRFLEK